VDDPWDVCLLKFMVDVVRQSAPININELGSRNLLKDDADTPRALRQSIEHAFLQAGRDPALIQALGAQLRRAGLFEEYEDRFFALIQQSKKKKPL